MASGTPKYISYGAEDLSSVQDLPEIAEKGTVILKSIIYAQKGPKYALVNGKNIINIFVEKTFDINSEYYFHNIKFLRQWVSRGSSAFVEKLDALNSTIAELILYVLLIHQLILYFRHRFYLIQHPNNHVHLDKHRMPVVIFESKVYSIQLHF
jgi:hypothetical protein